MYQKVIHYFIERRCLGPLPNPKNTVYELSGDNLTAEYTCIDGAKPTNEVIKEKWICSSPNASEVPWKWSLVTGTLICQTGKNFIGGL